MRQAMLCAVDTTGCYMVSRIRTFGPVIRFSSTSSRSVGTKPESSETERCSGSLEIPFDDGDLVSDAVYSFIEHRYKIRRERWNIQ